MIPDYFKIHKDMSLSPDIDKFLKNDPIQNDEIIWLGEEEIEGSMCKIGLHRDKKSLVIMSASTCFSVSIEALVGQCKTLE